MTLVANTKAQMVWEYTNFQFNSFCEVNGVIYGANADGVFIIDSGDTDDGAVIESSWSHGKLALDKTITRIPLAYVKATGDGDLKISLTADDEPPIEYTITPAKTEQSHRYRVHTAKGARGTYWQLKVDNVDGCDFRVDNIDLDVAVTARRI